MQKASFKTIQKASMSLTTLLRRQTRKLHPTFAAAAMGFTSTSPQTVRKEDRIAVLVEATDSEKLIKQLEKLDSDELVVPLSESILSANVSLSVASDLLKNEKVKRVQTKKLHQLHLDSVPKDINLAPSGTRLVSETGKNVLIGVVDSGFDLSHPMFRDGAGKIRVEALLDQTSAAPTTFSNAQLETGWSNGTNPGKDDNGHGTHVASIAGGTKAQGFEGIAPEVRFLLVKTNFRDTADGVSWIFNQAGTKPCVINMSLGMHFGSHDGTSAEELLIDELSGAGKIVVISAGNERERRLHLGHRFLPGEIQTVTFDVPSQPGQRPEAALTMWYDPSDDFNITLITPSGQQIPAPTIGNVDTFSSTSLDIDC